MDLINPPASPPPSWVQETPDWYHDGQTVQIMLDGDEAGRACGLVQPARGAAQYMSLNKHFGRDVPATTFDGLRSAHTGPMMFTGPDGEQRSVNCGTIALEGGHSSSGAGARTAEQAREWLNRRGVYAHLAEDDLVLYGRYTPVESGPNRGAMLFRGCVFPNVTKADAMIVNATTMSGENWPDPQYGGREVFVGAARVRRTAFPYNEPLALAATLTDDGAGFVIYSEPEPEGVMAAALEESDIAELRRQVDTITAGLEELTSAFAELAIQMVTADELTLDQRFEEVLARMSNLEAATQQQQSTGQPAPPSGDSADGQTSRAVNTAETVAAAVTR